MYFILFFTSLSSTIRFNSFIIIMTYQNLTLANVLTMKIIESMLWFVFWLVKQIGEKRTYFLLSSSSYNKIATYFWSLLNLPRFNVVLLIWSHGWLAVIKNIFSYELIVLQHLISTTPILKSFNIITIIIVTSLSFPSHISLHTFYLKNEEHRLVLLYGNSIKKLSLKKNLSSHYDPARVVL